MIRGVKPNVAENSRAERMATVSNEWGERVVRPGGLEPPAFWSVAKRSIHLSYGRTSFSEGESSLGSLASGILLRRNSRSSTPDERARYSSSSDDDRVNVGPSGGVIDPSATGGGTGCGAGFGAGSAYTSSTSASTRSPPTAPAIRLKTQQPIVTNTDTTAPYMRATIGSARIPRTIPKTPSCGISSPKTAFCIPPRTRRKNP